MLWWLGGAFLSLLLGGRVLDARGDCQMMYAEVDGERLLPFYGGRGKCPGCGGECIAKCGDIITHHWAHVAAECDPWHEPETAWHRRWKEVFPKDCQEIKVGTHRADVKVGSIVLEFQHSPLSPHEIAQREQEYGTDKMLWVVDARDAEEKEQFLFRRSLGRGPVGQVRTFRWKRAKKAWAFAKAPVIFHFGEGGLELLKKMYVDKRVGGIVESVLPETLALILRRPDLAANIRALLDDTGLEDARYVSNVFFTSYYADKLKKAYPDFLLLLKGQNEPTRNS